MKKTIITTVIAVVVAATAYSVFAEERQDSRPGRPMWSHKKSYEGWPMGGWGMRGMCPLHMALAKSLTNTQIVPGDDGEVIVMAGHKLMKYDKDLELIKAVELDIDIEAARKKMEQIMEDCPRRKELLRKQAEEAGNDR